MVDVAGIDVGAAVEQQVDHLAGAGEVERRLAVAAALAHPLRLRVQDAPQQIGPVQVRRRAGVRHGAGRDEAVGSRAARHMQRVEAAGPPVAAAIGIGAELEQQLDELQIVREMDEGGAVEGKGRGIDHRPRRRVAPKQLPNHGEISGGERLAELLLDRSGQAAGDLLDLRLQRRPALEPVLTRQDELGVRQRHPLLVGEVAAHALARGRVIVAERPQELLRPLSLLFEGRVRR
jgi:hypothetical protein